MDKVDLRKILNHWPYDPEENVRVVELEAGRHVIQVRLPFGMEQYERDGRPDGQRPHGCESLLAYHVRCRLEAEAKGAAFTLSPSDCAELFDEGISYYYRYLHLFSLQDWKRTARDTARNIQLFDFVKNYAAHEEDRAYLEQWRPYIVRIHAIAECMLCLRDDKHDKALGIIRSAISEIEALAEVDDPAFHYEMERSVTALRELAREIRRNKPLQETERLEIQLRRAVEREEFERAAELRDRLRSLRETRHA